MAARDTFIDLLPGGYGTYAWPLNHLEEDQGGRSVSIQRTAPVSGVGFVRQVSESGPLLLSWKGTILQWSHLNKMWNFYGVTNGWGPGSQRTIQLQDFQGGLFEVLFTSFQPIREHVTLNPRAERPQDKTVKWSYTAEFEVVNVVSGWP